jgi:hypothetical protein
MFLILAHEINFSRIMTVAVLTPLRADYLANSWYKCAVLRMPP